MSAGISLAATNMWLHGHRWLSPMSAGTSLTATHVSRDIFDWHTCQQGHLSLPHMSAGTSLTATHVSRDISYCHTCQQRHHSLPHKSAGTSLTATHVSKDISHCHTYQQGHRRLQSFIAPWWSRFKCIRLGFCARLVKCFKRSLGSSAACHVKGYEFHRHLPENLVINCRC